MTTIRRFEGEFAVEHHESYTSVNGYVVTIKAPFATSMSGIEPDLAQAMWQAWDGLLDQMIFNDFEMHAPIVQDNDDD